VFVLLSRDAGLTPRTQSAAGAPLHGRSLGERESAPRQTYSAGNIYSAAVAGERGRQKALRLRCPTLNINPKMLPRLDEIEDDLLARRARAACDRSRPGP
jgi:hypothetical protein